MLNRPTTVSYGVTTGHLINDLIYTLQRVTAANILHSSAVNDNYNYVLPTSVPPPPYSTCDAGISDSPPSYNSLCPKPVGNWHFNEKELNEACFFVESGTFRYAIN
ncbi:hypothetical protein NQ317_000748 [Molorchus minor]|uniref:Uncharacterized protein n=1 Tax=Molorchus minor TaxID=1323400 RepID=A0ABQ9IV94_9CUCU|nr:hypothetical protein NQ317_000748 [Molorchus minor]